MLTIIHVKRSVSQVECLQEWVRATNSAISDEHSPKIMLIKPTKINRWWAKISNESVGSTSL